MYGGLAGPLLKAIRARFDGEDAKRLSGKASPSFMMAADLPSVAALKGILLQGQGNNEDYPVSRAVPRHAMQPDSPGPTSGALRPARQSGTMSVVMPCSRTELLPMRKRLLPAPCSRRCWTMSPDMQGSLNPAAASAGSTPLPTDARQDPGNSRRNRPRRYLRLASQ